MPESKVMRKSCPYVGRSEELGPTVQLITLVIMSAVVDTHKVGMQTLSE